MRLPAILISLLSCITSYASLTIHIVNGVDKPYPIGISTFAGSTDNAITKIISHDLKTSGQFQIIDESGTKKTNWTRWKASGAEYVLTGSEKKHGINDSISFQLLSPINQATLLAVKFDQIPQAQRRALAHHISDQIYQEITGVRGYFSTRIAYVTTNKTTQGVRYQLVIADADGANPRTLISQYHTPIMSPAWSPDGKQIAYVSYQHNRMHISVITLSTGKVQQQKLSSFSGIVSSPSYAPNGKILAMALSHANSANTNIYLMNIKSKKLTQVTHLATNTSPSFSPDGKHIVFTSNRGGSAQIYQLNLKTKKIKRLTFDGTQNYDPVYTPNGKDIVFMHIASPGAPIQLAVYHLDTQLTQTITTGTLDKSPSISPNSRMVIYANYDQAHGRLAEASINGKIHLILPSSSGSVQSPAWSPYLD